METNLTVSPLSSYLMALGLLRIASTQLPGGTRARGCWRQGRFHLDLPLLAAELSEFLANEYRPSPCLTPWNKPRSSGPGFLNGQVPAAIQALGHPRFEELQRVASVAARIMPEFVDGGRVEGDSKRLAFEALSREGQSDAFTAWLEVCAVIGVDAKGKPVVRYPALLGGSAGFLAADFGTQFVASLAAARAEHFEAAVFGSSAPDLLLRSGNTLIYDPAGRGDGQQGYRVAVTDVHPTTANPAELVLLAEGMSFFQGYAITDQSETQNQGGPRPASFTLAVVHNSSGHASTSWLENKGQTSEELWCPLWDEPVTFQDLRMALGRVAMLPLPRQLRTGTDFALFASRLGRRHGLSGFARYSFPPRVGQGTKIPSLIEVFYLSEEQEDRSDALADVAGFSWRLRRIAADRSIPTSYRNSAEHVVAELEALSGGGGSFTSLLRHLVAWRRQEQLKPEADQLQRYSFGRRELPAAWFELLHREIDGPEWRLALTLATGNSYTSLHDICLMLDDRIDTGLLNDLEAGIGWIDRAGLPQLPDPADTIPWLPPDYLAGLLLHQWRCEESIPIQGDRDRWRELLRAHRPEEAMAVALQRLQNAEVVSWRWPVIANSDPQRLLRAVAVRIDPISLERAWRQG
ncbi:MAG: type I-U CRISPR-associated protein Csx17 [Synechococcus sp.]|nr:type I-U CRISPR-associated protein Csx17 [Synechococcus sp.]